MHNIDKYFDFCKFEITKRTKRRGEVVKQVEVSIKDKTEFNWTTGNTALKSVRRKNKKTISEMMPYSSGLILDNTNNYGIVKTETVFGFIPPNHTFVNDNVTGPVEWVFKPGSFERRSFQDTSRALGKKKEKPKNKSITSKQSKKQKRKSKGKINKCIYKVIKEPKRSKRRRNKFKMPKKMMMPLILGLLAAKSLLIPVALKALAFLSVKGLMMGFFSTVLASILSLKGMFDNSHVQNRKDEGKTQVEIIQVPSKSEDHIYYDDHHYRRDDMPVVMSPEFRHENE